MREKKEEYKNISIEISICCPKCGSKNYSNIPLDFFLKCGECNNLFASPFLGYDIIDTIRSLNKLLDIRVLGDSLENNKGRELSHLSHGFLLS